MRTDAGSPAGHNRLRIIGALTVALLTVATLVTGCGGSTSQPAASADTLGLGFRGDLGGPPDPDTYYDAQGLMLIKNVYEGLLRYQPGTPEKKIIPWLATDWTVSPDNLTYTFTLRDGVKFHDGTPFDSSAVKASFARRTAVNGGPAYMLADVVAVETPEPLTAVVRLAKPNADFLDYLACAYAPQMMSPKGLAEHAGGDHAQTYLQEHDLGTGPYTLADVKTNEFYSLKAFAEYWGEKPHFTTVNFPVVADESSQIIQTNQGRIGAIVHFPSAATVQQFANNSKFKVHNFPSLQNQEVYMNPHRGFLTSPEARMDLLKAIDVSAAMADLEKAGMSEPSDTMSPKGQVPDGYALQNISYDTEPLRTRVAALPADQRTLQIAYQNDASDDQLVADRIAAQLSALGLQATVTPITSSQRFSWVGDPAAARNAPEILLAQFGPDARTAYAWTHLQFDTDGGLQFFSCEVPGVDELDAQAVATGSMETFNRVAELAWQTGCWLNIGNRATTMIVDASLTGVDQAYTVGTPSTLELVKLGRG